MNNKPRIINEKDLIRIPRMVKYFESCWEDHTWIAFQKGVPSGFHGIVIVDHTDGTLFRKETFERGKLVVEETYNQDEIKESSYTYKKDGGVDYQEIFYKTGELKEKIRWKEGGKILSGSGSFESYYINGKLKEKGNLALEDFKVGLWEYFDEEGNLTKTEEYKDGVLQE